MMHKFLLSIERVRDWENDNDKEGKIAKRERDG